MFQNYSKYTLDELYNIEKHVDREAYPDRYEMVVEQISIKESANQELSASEGSADEANPPSIVWPTVGSIVIFLYLIYALYSGELLSRSGAIIASESPRYYWATITVLVMLLLFELFQVRRLTNFGKEHNQMLLRKYNSLALADLRRAWR